MVDWILFAALMIGGAFGSAWVEAELAPWFAKLDQEVDKLERVVAQLEKGSK